MLAIPQDDRGTVALHCRAVRRAVEWGLIILAAVGLVESFTTWPPARPGSLTGNPNLLAVFMLCGLALSAQHRRWSTFGLFALVLALTGSRAAILGAGVGAVVYLVAARKVVKFTTLPILAALALAPLAALQIAASDHARLALRLDLWRIALRLFAQHPLTGAGLGSYARGFIRYAQLEHSAQHFHAHNLVLQVMAETGLIGLAALLTLLAALAWRIVRAYRGGAQRPARIAAALLAALLAEGMLDYVYWFWPLTVTAGITGWLLLRHRSTTQFPY